MPPTRDQKTDPLLTRRIQAANPADAPRSRGPFRAPPAIGRLLGEAANAVFKKHGFEEPYIWQHWTEIVGPMLAQHTAPEHLSRSRGAAGRTLTILVPGPLALEVQHLTPQILDRINTFYGYKAVDKLRLVHAAPTQS